MTLSLDELPGIGKKLKEKIIERFSDEKRALTALKNGMGGAIPGISQKQAIKFARLIFESEHKTKIEDVLKTDHVLDLYNQIVEYISEYFITEYSKNKILLYFPLGPQYMDIINERYNRSTRSLEFVKRFGPDLEKKGIMDNLKQLSLLKKEEGIKKIKSRCIITDDKSFYESLKEDEINKIINIEFVNSEKIKDPEEYFKEFSKTFETVVIVTNNSDIIPNYLNFIPVDIKDVTNESIIPEKTIFQFSSNSKIINSIYNISKILQEIPDKSLISEFLTTLIPEKIEILRQNTKILDDNGSIIRGYDKELDIFRDDAVKFSGKIVEIENHINDIIHKEINKSSITIHGEKILDLYRSDASLDNIRHYIPQEVDDIISESIETGINEVEKALHLTKKEHSWIEDLYPEVIEIPVSLNPEAIDELEFNIKQRAAVYNYNLMRKIAESLQENESYLNEIIWVMLEFDFFYGIGRFAKDYHLNIPKITKEKRGISFENSNNLELMRKTIKQSEATVPISYTIGNFTIGSATPSRLNLLSGSNSGGKTMCLLTTAQVLILAQMGFPCPGSVNYYPFSEIYFFKKSSGQISAGAFESTLLMFVDLAQSPKEKLVLADELEAITEPNAASRVISAIFSLLLENQYNYAVFVTHLIEMLMVNLTETEKKNIRVDGIEARGLDENLDLVVDRNPRFNYIAKSTPEFILERLSKKGKDNQKEFFKKILTKFNRNDINKIK
jgi:DNA mismatch repair protein MutS2